MLLMYFHKHITPSFKAEGVWYGSSKGVKMLKDYQCTYYEALLEIYQYIYDFSLIDT